MPVKRGLASSFYSLLTASQKSNFIHRAKRTGSIAVVCVLISVPAVLSAQESLPRELLVQMYKDQSSQLCTLKSFTQCMNFSEKECLALSEQAVQQCLMPLPEKIILSELKNDSIEACPKQVYEDAGYSDEKAKACLLEANNK
jgi:hypothetical protein